jgi:hypothetical protein
VLLAHNGTLIYTTGCKLQNRHDSFFRMQGWAKVTCCVTPLSMFHVLKSPTELLCTGRGEVTALKNEA